MAIFQPFRPAYLADPYPYLHRLRAEEPVHRSGELNAWVITRHSDALRILTDEDHFSSDPATSSGPMGEAIRATRDLAPMGHTPILGNTDAPEHTRLRAIVNRAFTPRTVTAFEPELRRLVQTLVAQIEPGRPLDFMRQVAEPLAVLSILAFIGVSPGDVNRVRGWGMAIMAARAAERAEGELYANAERAREEFAAYLTSTPQNGVMGELLAAAAEGERISIDEMMMLVIHISTAGNGPAALGLANCVLSLANHPEQHKLLRERPEQAPRALEELLRFDGPVHLVHRFVREPIELGGRKLRKGETAMVVISAANRDPDVFPEPDTLDITRDPGRHLSFGQGVHFCLGAPLARVELALAIGELAKRFERLEIVPPGIERAPDLLLRGPRSLILRAT